MDCLEDRFYKIWRLWPTNASLLFFFRSSILVLLFLVLCPSYSSLECRRRGAAGRLRRRGQAQAPRAGSGAASGAGGGHHARGCAGSRRLPPQRPARALPRPGPHAPISEELLGGVGGRSAKRREGALEAGFAAVTEADGERSGGRRSRNSDSSHRWFLARD